MSEAINETVQTENVGKPYTFRLLGAPDIFLMATIISKIGINEFKVCFENDGIKNLIQNAMEEASGNEDEPDFIKVGAGVFLDVANVILGNIGKCEKEIYQMLSNTSNLSVSEIKKPGNAAMFLEMLIDFVQKEEFRDFIKVASKLFK